MDLDKKKKKKKRTCQNDQPELVDILDVWPEVGEVILCLLGMESLVLDILVAFL